MALATTDYGPFFHDNTGFVGQGTSPYVTGSFTPPDNSLLVVVVATSGETASLDTDCVLTGGSLTWTKRISKLADWDGAEGALVQIWTAPVTTGASMTLTVTHTGHDQYSMYVIPRAYTGHDTTTPTGVTGTGESRTTSVSLTLSGAPATDSEVIAAIAVLPEADAGLTFTPGSGFTEITSPYSNNSFYSPQTQRRTASTSTAVSWTTGTAAANPFDNKAAAALEIKAAAGGTAVPGDGSASGTGTATATGAIVLPANGSASGVGDAQAGAAQTQEAAGSASGTGTGTAGAEQTQGAAGSASGTGDATATGADSSGTVVAGNGSASGTGDAQAGAAQTQGADGSASGAGDAQAGAAQTQGAAGSASGISDATATVTDNMPVVTAGAGSASGTSDATATGSGGLIVAPTGSTQNAAGGAGGGQVYFPKARTVKPERRVRRTHVIRVGEWPEGEFPDPVPVDIDPLDMSEILRAQPKAVRAQPEEDDEEALMALLAFAA